MREQGGPTAPQVAHCHVPWHSHTVMSPGTVTLSCPLAQSHCHDPWHSHIIVSDPSFGRDVMAADLQSVMGELVISRGWLGKPLDEIEGK